MPHGSDVGRMDGHQQSERTTSQDLNLTVGGTILLTDAHVKKLQKGELFKILIKIMDEDTFSDDTVHTDNSFSVGMFDTTPNCFHVGVIVPHPEPERFGAVLGKPGANLSQGAGEAGNHSNAARS